MDYKKLPPVRTESHSSGLVLYFIYRFRCQGDPSTENLFAEPICHGFQFILNMHVTNVTDLGQNQYKDAHITLIRNSTSPLSHTSYVLFEVVLLPFTPCVAMTALKLSPSTRSLYLFLPLCSSMWMTARATSGIPWTTTFQVRNENKS